MTRLYLDTAIRLPAPDVEALIQGRAIAALPQQFLDPGRIFALYPADAANSRPINSATVQIKAWARCELCQILDKSEPLEFLSRLTIWTTAALENILSQRPYIFLAYFRVYLLPDPLEIPANDRGQFVGLPQAMSVSESSPVLSDRTFTHRRHQLENRLPPLHPELEELQSAIAQLNTPEAKQLDDKIQIFLGWKAENNNKNNPDLDWIKTIAAVGNSSDGQNFEKLVRKGLIKLGFTNSNRNPKASLDPESTGGAGGIDVYCEAPYPVVAECKASKKESVPNSVTAQLIHLGVTHLGQAQFDRSIKLIFAAGHLTEAAHKAAVENKMNVIRPETLQSLVELQAQHKNSVDLLELKQCLQQEPFGLADDKIKSYIEKVKQDIKLRSQIVQAVKELTEQDNCIDATQKQFTVIEIRVHYNATQNPKLTDELVRDLLIELSSPLTGYLGRKKGSDWRSDRFYFLRDLLVD